MWSTRPQKVAPSEITLGQSSTLHTAIRSYRKGGKYNLLRRFSGATLGYHRLGLKRTYISLCIWHSTLNSTAQPEWLQLAAQPLQCVGYLGRRSTRSRRQPPITGAVWSVSNLNALNDFEHYWRLGDSTYNHRRQYPFIPLKMSLDGSTGTFLLTTRLTPMNPDESLPLRAYPPLRHLYRDKREDRAWGCLFFKKRECRSTPARHAVNSFQKERHPNAQGKLKL